MPSSTRHKVSTLNEANRQSNRPQDCALRSMGVDCVDIATIGSCRQSHAVSTKGGGASSEGMRRRREKKAGSLSRHPPKNDNLLPHFTGISRKTASRNRAAPDRSNFMRTSAHFPLAPVRAALRAPQSFFWCDK